MATGVAHHRGTELMLRESRRINDERRELLDIVRLLIGTPARDTDAIIEIQRRADALVKKLNQA